MFRYSFSTIVVLMVSLVPRAGAASSQQFWAGATERDGQRMDFRVRLQETHDGLAGALDLPDFGALGIPLHERSLRKRDVHLVFASNSAEHVLDGTIRGDTMEGTWQWKTNGFSTPFTLERIDDPRPYTSEEVTFTNGDVSLAGTVFSPKTPGRHPAIVLIHGSGAPGRWWLEHYADFFARQGLVALFFDKRGTGASTGDWHTVGFEPLARDGLAGLHLLQNRPDVDPDRLGFWGISQAGWIMPLAASFSDDVKFLLITSGPAIPVAEEVKYDYLVRVRDAGFSEEDLAEANRILDLDHHVTMTGEGYDDLRALVKEAHKKPWWKVMEFFPNPVGARKFNQLIEGYEPRPILDKLDVPTLWMYGLADKSVEPSKNIDVLNEIMAASDKPWTIKTFPRANHGIRIPPEPDAAFPISPYAPGYFDAMAAWLREHGLTRARD